MQISIILTDPYTYFLYFGQFSNDHGSHTEHRIEKLKIDVIFELSVAVLNSNQVKLIELIEL